MLQYAVHRPSRPKMCLIYLQPYSTFEIYVPEALLYIDGEEVDYESPVELRYGVYRLMVIADGFDTWERQLVIHSSEATIEIGDRSLTKEADPDAGGGGGKQRDLRIGGDRRHR